ncbi:hypothetical protein CALCODRAFT_204631 [Calocera cornea HHB12733]|uniref:Uncharacterized protein n=1 Tax=Calocera cornea HHB12733 TaxID=1353952 RepID=A0A165K018_9BASI|nr:hypothetical protein CALCODRAFT_204631 [Calocera cornea HHB12733]
MFRLRLATLLPRRAYSTPAPRRPSEGRLAALPTARGLPSHSSHVPSPSGSSAFAAPRPYSPVHTQKQKQKQKQRLALPPVRRTAPSRKPPAPPPAAAPPAPPHALLLTQARKLLSQGAHTDRPLDDMDEAVLTQWIAHVQTADLPATAQQLAYARALVEQGAPAGGRVREQMRFGELAEWLEHAKKYTSYQPPSLVPTGRARRTPASGAQLRRAALLSRLAGRHPPYPPAPLATKGEVSDFLLACKAELARRGTPVWLPSEPQRAELPTEGQRRKLARLGVQLHEGMTRGEASDRLTELQREGGVALGSE